MVAEVFAGLGAIKSAFDIAKGLKDIDNAARRNAAVIELQEKILTAQQEQSALIEQVSDLKKTVAQLKAWETEKQRYTLAEIGTGTFAYVIKNSMRGSEPAHCICCECYERGQKSILQIIRNVLGSVTLRCPKCKTEFFASEDHEDYPLKREHAISPEEAARAGLEDCPLCQEGKLKTVKIRPDRMFGPLGVQQHTLKCDRCEHSEDRMHNTKT